MEKEWDGSRYLTSTHEAGWGTGRSETTHQTEGSDPCTTESAQQGCKSSMGEGEEGREEHHRGSGLTHPITDCEWGYDALIDAGDGIYGERPPTQEEKSQFVKDLLEGAFEVWDRDRGGNPSLRSGTKGDK